ncbi:MAG: CDP-alcohol phosphatidyltransferase family protein [Candidatus Omnitrophica bacterium]|nr:CDP-alcohol phosphatidyltransferase family protein [Candidatus Omnitrophota bacterium]
MNRIDELREKLQGPRRHADTLYGRLVMRRLSIYVTAFLSLFPISPFWVNLASILCGVAGAWMLSRGQWIAGVLLVNGWYLLDHVDGELARYRRVFYATGLFFDSMANTIVVPAAFVGIGSGLAVTGSGRALLLTGFAAAYGSMMLFAVPYCESAVILQRVRQGRIRLETTPGAVIKMPERGSFYRNAFSFLHGLATFPVFLPIFTALIFGSSLVSPPFLDRAVRSILLLYAFLTNSVWMAVMGHAVISLKIDKRYPPVSS